MKNKKILLISALACCAMFAMTGCSDNTAQSQQEQLTSSVSSSVEDTSETLTQDPIELDESDPSDDGKSSENGSEMTLESYLTENPEVLESMEGTESGVSIEVEGNSLTYTYQFEEGVLTGDATTDQSILDTVMEGEGIQDTFQQVVDTLSDSTGLPVQMNVVYQNSDGDTVGAYSYVAADADDMDTSVTE